MLHLYLEDLKNHNEEEIRKHFVTFYDADPKEVSRYEIVIAYESVGDYGCDSSSFFLLKEISTGELYEVHGSHCSCYGFEEQFKPEKTTKEYLLSDKFSFSTGGYDSLGGSNRSSVKKFLKENIQ